MLNLRSPHGGDHAVHSSWASGFQPLEKTHWLEDAKSGLEDKWEFEADTYTLGIISIIKVGLPGATFQLLLSLLTPTIQLAAFFRIFEHLITEPRSAEGAEDAGPSTTYVRLICFMLMALQLSNEALEGFQKLVYCLRNFAGIYMDVKGLPIFGIIIGFMQFGMAVGTVGLSMLVVSEQTTALDAFMNFVALAFLTEIDNLLMSARTIQNFVEVETEVTSVIQPSYFAGKDSLPWTVQMMCVGNAITILAWIIMCGMFLITAMYRAEPEDPPPWPAIAGHLPSCIVALVTLNVIMWFGSRRVGTVAMSLITVAGCVLLDAVDKVGLYLLHQRVFSPLMLSVTIWFEMAAPATSFALTRDTFHLLRCPVRAPLLVWAMLVQSVFMFDALYRFGLD